MGKLKVEEMPLFAKPSRAKRRARTEWRYVCVKCGSRIVTGIEVRGSCNCGGLYKEERDDR